MSVKQQHGVALRLGFFYICVLLVFVVGIEVHQCAIFVSLCVFDERFVLFEGEVFSLRVLEQCEVLGAVIESLVRQHTVVDEHL